VSLAAKALVKKRYAGRTGSMPKWKLLVLFGGLGLLAQEAEGTGGLKRQPSIRANDQIV
jgi:hypothetical protein